MNLELLEDIGLTHNQASIYTTLLERGSLSASKIMRRTGIERSLVYVVLNELISLKLVTRDDSKKVAEFRANSPQPLQNLVQKKEHSAELAKNAFETTFYQLQQAFEIQSGQPGIRFYLGAKGLKDFYKQLNKAKPENIYLVRSTEVESNKEMEEVVQEQIQQQIKLGIKVNVITPTLESLTEVVPLDEERLTERRIIDKSVFNTSSQVIIYDNVVAHTTYREPNVTTVLEHEDIAATMMAIFSILWKKTERETRENFKKYTK